MKKLESTLLNMVMVLTGFAVFAGGILATINHITTEPIAQANAKALAEAIAKVVPGFNNDPASEVNTVTVDGNAYVVYKAKKDGEPIGVAIESSANGFAGALKILVGFDNEGKIIDYSLLSHSETPGLGSKAAEWFRQEGKGDIRGKDLSHGELTVSKDGGEIDAITASTITSRAFLVAVGRAYKAFQETNKQQ